MTVTKPDVCDPIKNVMNHREITLPDGRYMIFYTFDQDGTSGSKQADAGESRPNDEVNISEPNDV